NATSPKAKTGAADMRADSPDRLTRYATPIRPTMTMPSQYPPKFPATIPERMSSDATPSRAEVTTSRTCPDSVEVKTLTSSGMMAPARVPEVMTVESFHQSVPSPSPGMSSQETM